MPKHTNPVPSIRQIALEKIHAELSAMHALRRLIEQVPPGITVEQIERLKAAAYPVFADADAKRQQRIDALAALFGLDPLPPSRSVRLRASHRDGILPAAPSTPPPLGDPDV